MSKGELVSSTGINLVDNAMIPVCRNLRRYGNEVFEGVAIDGKGTMDAVMASICILPVMIMGKS